MENISEISTMPDTLNARRQNLTTALAQAALKANRIQRLLDKTSAEVTELEARLIELDESAKGWNAHAQNMSLAEDRNKKELETAKAEPIAELKKSPAIIKKK